MALAIAVPSNVDVPLPSSSMITNERLVAPRTAAEVSASSTKNVDCPHRILSEAPRRVKIRSTGVSAHLSAGT